MLDPKERWIVRCHIGWRDKRSIFYKIVKIYPQQTCYKNLGEKLESESPKRPMSANGGLEWLQMVLESETNWYVSEDAGPERGEYCERSHIDWREE